MRAYASNRLSEAKGASAMRRRMRQSYSWSARTMSSGSVELGNAARAARIELARLRQYVPLALPMARW